MTLRQRLPPAFGHRHPQALYLPKPPLASGKPVPIQSLAYIAEMIGKNAFAWLKMILPRHAQTFCPTASVRAARKPPFAPSKPIPLQSLAYAVMFEKIAFAWLKVILLPQTQTSCPTASVRSVRTQSHCPGLNFVMPSRTTHSLCFRVWPTSVIPCGKR